MLIANYYFTNQMSAALAGDFDYLLKLVVIGGKSDLI